MRASVFFRFASASFPARAWTSATRTTSPDAVAFVARARFAFAMAADPTGSARGGEPPRRRSRKEREQVGFRDLDRVEQERDAREQDCDRVDREQGLRPEPDELEPRLRGQE